MFCLLWSVEFNIYFTRKFRTELVDWSRYNIVLYEAARGGTSLFLIYTMKIKHFSSAKSLIVGCEWKLFTAGQTRSNSPRFRAEKDGTDGDQG